MANTIGGGGDPGDLPDTINDGLPVDEPREFWRYRLRRNNSDVVYRDWYDGPITMPTDVPYGGWVVQIDDELSEAATMFQSVYLATTAAGKPSLTFQSRIRYVTSYNIYDNLPDTDRYYELVPILGPPTETLEQFGGSVDLIYGTVYHNGGERRFKYLAYGTNVSAETDQFGTVQPTVEGDPYQPNMAAIICAIQPVIRSGVRIANAPLQKFNNYVQAEVLYRYASGGIPADTVEPYQTGQSKRALSFATGCNAVPDDDVPDEPTEVNPFENPAIQVLVGALAAALVVLVLPELVAGILGVETVAAVGSAATAIEGSAVALGQASVLSAEMEISALEAAARIRGILGAVETVEVNAARARAEAVVELAKQQGERALLRNSLR